MPAYFCSGAAKSYPIHFSNRPQVTSSEWREAQHSASRPLTAEEINELKDSLKRRARTAFTQLFHEG